ncbi:MAG: Gfo/Idh/MocA family oxidoreductase [Phycisphaerales bacterium]|jgi:predicted dehydrogenase
MSEKELRTAVLGLKEEGEGLLETIAGSEHYKLIAVADKDSELVERVAQRYGCSAFDDYRQFVIGNELDVLVVAAGLYSCEQYVKSAIRKKFNILKVPPAGRDFGEAVELAKLAEENEVIFTVASAQRFSKKYSVLREFVEQQEERPLLITAVCSYSRQTRPAWYGDPKLAGGGVLLRDCYGFIDELVLAFGVPEQVYSTNTNMAADRQQRHALTEDIAVVVMRFSDNFCVNLVAKRSSGENEKSETLELYYRNKVVTVSDSSLTAVDVEGKKLKSKRFGQDDDSDMCQMLESFALGCLVPEENKPVSTMREHLNNMAVIEAAYLSARTRMPEEPGRILAMTDKYTDSRLSLK